MEYALQINSKEEEQAIVALLQGTEGVQDFTVDYKKQLVLVIASRTSIEIADVLESTGKKVRIRGLGNQGICGCGRWISGH